MGKTCTGVDIGESSIKLAVCEGDVVKKVVVESLPEGLVVDGRIVSRDAMADFIKSLAKAWAVFPGTLRWCFLRPTI